MGKYKSVRDIIRELMKDGKTHTAEEFERICEKNGIYMHNDRGPIYNVVYQLKKKGEIISDGENGYMAVGIGNACIERPNKTVTIEESSIDLSEFEIVRPAIRRKTKQVISIFENGDVVFNSELVKSLKEHTIEIRIKKDCKQLLLLPNGKEKFEIGKNSKFKNYVIYEKLREKRVKFPIYYVGDWNEKEEFWLGNLSLFNPNKSVDKNEIKRTRMN